jgi:hypothetical protein
MDARFRGHDEVEKREGRERSRPSFYYTPVIVREGGRSGIPRLLDSIAGRGDYWMPAFAGMTA